MSDELLNVAVKHATKEQLLAAIRESQFFRPRELES